MVSRRRRLLDILIPQDEQVQILYDKLDNKLVQHHSKTLDWNRRVFFDPYGGMTYLRQCYMAGEVTADRVRKCIQYHRELRQKFTMRLP